MENISLEQTKIDFSELSIEDIFEVLEKRKDKNSTFLNILKNKKDIEQTKDELLNQLYLINNGNEYDINFFIEERKKIIHNIDLNLFFASLTKEEIKILKKYKRYVGEIKDKKIKTQHIDWLIKNINQFFLKIENPQPDTLENFKDKYEKITKELIRLYTKENDDFSKREFHNFRKKIRTILNIIIALVEETNKTKYMNLVQKYKQWSKKIGDVLDNKSGIYPGASPGQKVLAWLAF